MHSLVRLYIKTAVGFLIVGLLLGGYLLARRELRGVSATQNEISAHTHVIVVSGAAQIVALVVFFYTMWSRIRGVGSQAREAAGERF